MDDLEALKKQLEMAKRAQQHYEIQAAAYSAIDLPVDLKTSLDAKRSEVSQLEGKIAKIIWEDTRLTPYKEWRRQRNPELAYICLYEIILVLNDSLRWSPEEQVSLCSQLPEEDIIELLSDVYSQDPKEGIDLHKKILLFFRDMKQSGQYCLIAHYHKLPRLLKGFFKNDPAQKCKDALRLWEDSTCGSIGREIVIFHLLNAFEKNPSKVIEQYVLFYRRAPELLIIDPRLRDLHQSVHPNDNGIRHRPWEFVVSSKFIRPKNPAHETAIEGWLQKHHIVERDPFSDWLTPLQDNAWLSNNSWHNPTTIFGELDDTHSLHHKLFTGEETWDVEAGFSRLIYEKELDGIYQNSTFIVVLSTQILYSEHKKVEETISEAIAHQWISYLLYNPRLFFYLSEDNKLRMVKLFLQVYRSTETLENEFAKQEQAIEDYTNWLNELQTTNQLTHRYNLPLPSKTLRWDQEFRHLLWNIKKLNNRMVILPDQNLGDTNQSLLELSLSLRPAGLGKTIILFSLPDPLDDIEGKRPSNPQTALASLLALSPLLAAHQAFFRGFTKKEYLNLPPTKDIQRIDLDWDQESLIDCLSQRCKSVSNEQIQSFNYFFSLERRDPTGILAQRARGSLGRLVRMGHNVLSLHIQNAPGQDQINPGLLDLLPS